MTIAFVRAPAKAAQGSNETFPPAATMKTAQVAAPLLMPMMSGDTSGFPTSDWKIAPEAARHMPARTATVIRGNRSELITKWYSPLLSQSAVVRASLAGIGKSPTVSPRSINAIIIRKQPTATPSERVWKTPDIGWRPTGQRRYDQRNGTSSASRSAPATMASDAMIAATVAHPGWLSAMRPMGSERPCITTRPAW